MPPKVEAPPAVERLAAENNQLKVEGLDQDDRLRRMQATVQKLEAEIAALLRKAKAMGMPLSAFSVNERDEEVDRLEATARDIEFRNEALHKQLLILKHTPAHALGKAKPSVFVRKQAWAPKTVAKPKPAERKEAKGGVYGMSEEEQRKFVAELQKQLANQQDLLKKAEQEAEEALIKAGANQENRWHLKTTDELRKVVKELETKTTMLQTSEDHMLKTMVNEQDGHRKLTDEVRNQGKDLAVLTEEIDALKKQKRVLELRKDGNAELRAEIERQEQQLLQLETENQALRLTAFSAGNAKITAKRNDDDRTALRAENSELKEEVDRLRAENSAMDAEILERESDEDRGIAALRARIEQGGADARLMARKTGQLRDKLDAFVGLEAADASDQRAVQAARELAKRMGVPVYLQAAGEGKDAGEVERLRREVRRLRVGNASEVREVGKLRQMLHLQAHLAGEWGAAGSSAHKQQAKMKRAHGNRVLGLERRIASAVAKNERLKQQIAAAKVDPRQSQSLSAALEGLRGDKSTSLRIEDMAAGKALVAVALDGLVLQRSFGDFGRVEPETMVVLDFFLHDTQHSPPLIGLAAPSVLRRELEVQLDSLFLRYLLLHAAQLQLLRVRGLEFEVIARADLPLRSLLLPDANGAMHCRLQLLSLPAGKVLGGAVVAELDASVHIQASAFGGLARTFMSKHRDAIPPDAPAAPAPAAELGAAARGAKEVLERAVGETYVLGVTVQSLASVVIPSLGLGGAPRPKLYAMFQLLDFPLEETDSVRFLDTAEAIAFPHATACYRIPATPAWDRKLLAGKLEIGVFDEADVGGDGLIGTASLMLAPLLSHRGVATTLPLRDGRDHNSGYLTVDVSWEAEPAPKLIMPGGAGRLLGKEAVREELGVLRQWVEALGLGAVEAACKALFEDWRKEPPDGGAWEGLTEGQWRGVLRREGAKVKLLSEARAQAVFHCLADEGGGGAPRLLRKASFVEAVTWSAARAAEAGGAGEGDAEGRELPGSGAGEMVEGDEVLASREFIRRAEGHSPERRAEGGGGAGGKGEALESARESGGLGGARVAGVGGGGGPGLRVAVRAVRCLEGLLGRKEVEELAVRVVCTVEGLAAGEQRFDNREVPSGFVELEKEWGRAAEERERLRDKARDAASAVGVQLWRVPPKRDDDSEVAELADQLLGVWRIPFSQLKAGGDLSRHTITVMSVGDQEIQESLLEATVDVEARAFLESVGNP